MKKLLVSILEGAIVGITMGIIIVILDIEMTSTQVGILIGSAIIVTSFASSIGHLINTGKAPVFYEWVYHYDGYRIAVSAGLTEKLYINDVLVDEKKGISSKAELRSKLTTGDEVKAVITGGMTAKCELFIGNQLLQPTSTKTPYN